MHKLVRTGRIAALFTITGVIIFIFFAKLYQLQILNGGSPRDDVISTITTLEVAPASRGDILDRNGTLLVSSEISYFISLSRNALLELDNTNDVLLTLAKTAQDYGINYTDTFPVTSGAPFDYLANITGLQSYYLSEYFDFFGLDPEISASDFIVWIKDHYDIDYTTPIAEARVIIGLRYELELRVIVGMDAYVFADDVSTEFISIVEEQGLPGVNIEITTSRVYNTDYAAHILGYLGKMDAEDYEYYKELGYPMDATIGQAGVERAFEEYLHGTDGLQRVTRAEETGAVVGVNVIEPAVSGKNVYLSVDLGLQQVAENSLDEKINQLNETRESGDMVTGGAVVVEHVQTGEMMAVASYPTFDLSSFFSDYNTLLNDSTNPLFNRATLGTYNPGSTFKMITSYAALITGTITRYTTVNDTGIYTRYPDYQPRCWIYPQLGYGHGELDVVGALQNSCNYFYYWVSDQMGANAITRAVETFGFGKSTGIEIGDSYGTVSSPAYKEEVLKEDWYAADTLMTAIGQGHNQFTPIQMANYVSVIANGGTLYKQTLLKSVKSADYTETVFDNTSQILSTFPDEGKAILPILQEGMRAVGASGGTAAAVFADYPIEVACKTGTVQADSGASDNGVFVCYAPADNPEIAVTIVVERGTSGTAIMTIARDIFDYYFGDRVADITVTAENELLP